MRRTPNSWIVYWPILAAVLTLAMGAGSYIEQFRSLRQRVSHLEKAVYEVEGNGDLSKVQK